MTLHDNSSRTASTASKETTTVTPLRPHPKFFPSLAHLRVIGLMVVLVGAFATAAPAHADPYTLKSFSNDTTAVGGAPYTAAGGHPDLNTNKFSVALPGPLNGTYVNPPLGFLGNPAAAARCPISMIPASTGPVDKPPVCPAGSQIGVATIGICLQCQEFQRPLGGGFVAPIYNIPPERGYPAQFAFKSSAPGVPTVISVFPQPRTLDYGLTVGTPNIVSIGVMATDIAFFGTPSQHGSGSTGAPFLSNPLDCSNADPVWRIAVDSSSDAGQLIGLGIPDPSDPDRKSVV